MTYRVKSCVPLVWTYLRTFALVVEPAEFTTAVLLVVEGRKPLVDGPEFGGEVEL